MISAGSTELFGKDVLFLAGLYEMVGRCPRKALIPITFIYIEVRNITLLTDLFYIHITDTGSAKHKRKTNFEHLHNT